MSSSVATGPWTGRRLGGRYRVGQLIGKGGMGTVYEAVQENLGRRASRPRARTEAESCASRAASPTTSTSSTPSAPRSEPTRPPSTPHAAALNACYLAAEYDGADHQFLDLRITITPTGALRDVVVPGEWPHCKALVACVTRVLRTVALGAPAQPSPDWFSLVFTARAAASP